MGTRGFKVYRHKGWYFRYYNHWDSYPAGFGVEVLAEIPTDPEQFREWLEGMRRHFDELLEEHQDVLNKNWCLRDDSGREITLIQPTKDTFIEWVYEIDLDHLVFHIDCAPMYRLDHMPPTDLFLKGVSLNMYGNRACDRDVPAEYRFTLDFPPPPPVENSALEKYHNSVQESAPCTVNALLSLNTAPVLADVIIQERTVYLHICMHNRNKAATELAFLSDVQTMSSKQRCFAFNLAAHALLPPSHLLWTFFGGPQEAADTVQGQLSLVSNSEELVWWPRRHICVLIATHLVHEDNRKAAIAQVVEEITKKDGHDVPDIVYGVVFSIFHCVLVRVDKRDNGRFTHTDVLSSCPDFFASGEHTEQTLAGLEAMIRLGNLPADDDIDFFYHLLRSSFWISGTREQNQNQKPATDSKESKCSDSEDTPFLAPHGPRLPQELLMDIAELIDDPRTLSVFACASRSTMGAALPRLRLPHIPLFAWQTGLILHRALPEYNRIPDASVFGAVHEGQPLLVVVSSSAVDMGCEEVARQEMYASMPPVYTNVCFTVFREL